MFSKKNYGTQQSSISNLENMKNNFPEIIVTEQKEESKQNRTEALMFNYSMSTAKFSWQKHFHKYLKTVVFLKY